MKKVLKILLIGLMKVMTKKKFSVIGIGYVGLPLAVALSRNNKIVGFDTNINRVQGLRKGNDITNEFSKNNFKQFFRNTS